MESIHNDSLVGGSSDERGKSEMNPEEVTVLGLDGPVPLYYALLDLEDLNPLYIPKEKSEEARSRLSEIIKNHRTAVLNCQGLDIKAAKTYLEALYQ